MPKNKIIWYFLIPNKNDIFVVIVQSVFNIFEVCENMFY